MTDYTVNRPGDQSPLSATRMDPTYGRLTGHMSAGSLGGYPADYVASLTGALGSLDINAMVSAWRRSVLTIAVVPPAHSRRWLTDPDP